MPDNSNSPPPAPWIEMESQAEISWSEYLQRYMDSLRDRDRGAYAWNVSHDQAINEAVGYYSSANNNIPLWVSVNEDTDKTPAYRETPCLNCKHHWGHHMGWACPVAGRQRQHWFRSELLRTQRFLTPDMKGIKKYSCVSKKRLQKMAREQMLSKESLLK